jgi:hypothetical protein
MASEAGQGEMENVDYLDQLEPRVNLEFKGCLDYQEGRVIEDTREHLEIRDRLVLVEWLEMTDLRVCQEFQEKWVQEVFQVLEDSMVFQEHLGFQEQKVALDLRVMKGPRDHLGLLE